MDETPVYIDLVPGKGFLICKTGAEKKHATVVLAVAGSGNALLPMVIFKGKKNLYLKAPQGLIIEFKRKHGTLVPKPTKKTRKVNCLLTRHLKENHEMWVAIMKEEEEHAEKLETSQQDSTVSGSVTSSNSAVNESRPEMESIKEESDSPSSLSPTIQQVTEKSELEEPADDIKDKT